MTDFFVDPLRLSSNTEPAAIVSLRRQAGTRRTERHSHGRGQLIGSLEGAVSIVADKGRWLVPPVNALWLPPHIEHAFASHGPFHGWSVYVSETACQNLPSAPRVIRLSGLLREAVGRAANWEAGALSRVQENIANVILDEIAGVPEEVFELRMPVDPRLQRIAKAIADEPADRRRMEEWAAWSGIAPRTLSRRFASETGQTFIAWRQRALLLRSLEMLAEGRAVTTIAFDLGYQTVSAFIDLFRNHFGVTPGRYAEIGIASASSQPAVMK